jgi:Tol biopolymer transport system component
MGRTLLIALALLSACGRTDLDGGRLDDTSKAPPVDTGPDEPPPDEPPPDEPPPDEPPPESGPLPEICIASRVQAGGIGNDSKSSLLLFAPLSIVQGPIAVSVSGAWNATFSPRGTRFAFSDDEGLSVVDSWPPEPELLYTPALPTELSFLDERRLIVNARYTLELHDLEAGSRELLRQVDATNPISSESPIYLVRPSPDARWVAYAETANGIHEIWLLDLEASPRAPIRLMTLAAGAVLAWLDWAPDSEHLGISVTDSNGVWLRSYSVATTESSFEVLPISFELEGTESIPTFQWSPTGDALHYYYQRVDLDTSETDWRLYLVDMTNAAPGPSVLLSDFDERNWPSPGHFSPKGDKVAFSADFAGATFRAAQFISDVASAPEKPQKQHPDEFESVLKQAWAPDGQTLYFTAMQSNQVEHLYRSSLSGSGSLVSSPSANVRGLYVSTRPGCIAYSQYDPTPAVVVVDEGAGELYELGDPQSNNPGWTGSFNSSVAHWVSDRNGAPQGLLYVTSDSNGADALAWAPVDGCVPSTPRTVIGSQPLQAISGIVVSTTPPDGERF